MQDEAVMKKKRNLDAGAALSATSCYILNRDTHTAVFTLEICGHVGARPARRADRVIWSHCRGCPHNACLCQVHIDATHSDRPKTLCLNLCFSMLWRSCISSWVWVKMFYYHCFLLSKKKLENRPLPFLHPWGCRWCARQALGVSWWICAGLKEEK